MSTETIPSPFISKSEFLILMRWSEPTLRRRLLTDPDCPRPRKSGRAVLFVRTEVDAYIATVIAQPPKGTGPTSGHSGAAHQVPVACVERKGDADGC